MGHWHILHPEKKLVGRAFTAQFMPLRKDVNDVIEANANKQGHRNSNQRAIDMLENGDVMVADLFGTPDSFTRTISLRQTGACYTTIELVLYLHLEKFSWPTTSS